MTTSARANLPSSLQAHLKKSWQSRIGKILISLACLLILLASLSWLFLPSYVKRIATEQVQQQLGRKLEIGAMHFSPFALAMTADHLTLYEADQKTVAVSVKNLLLNLSLSSAWHRALVIDEIRLGDPYVHLARTSAEDYGRYNFSDIIDKIAAQPKSSSAPLRFSLANVQLQNGSITFDDQVVKKQTRIEALQIALPFLSNFPTEVNSFVQPMLSAKINGTPFELKARSKPFVDSLDTTLAIDIDQLDVPNYLAYVPIPMPLKIHSAKLSTRLDLVFSRKQQRSEILLSGKLQLHKLAVNDHADAPLLQSDAISAQLKQVNLLTGVAAVDQLQMEAPQVWLDLDKKGQLNWLTLAKPDADKKAGSTAAVVAKTAAPAPGKKSAPALTLNILQINKGQVHFSDAVHSSPVSTINLKEIALTVRQFSTDAAAKPASILLHLRTEQDAQATFEGEFSSAHGMADGQMALTTLPLEAYQAYLNPLLAATLAGKLSVQSHLHSQDGQWQISDLNAQLADFSMQAKTKGEGGIALKSLSLGKLNLDTASRRVNAASLDLHGIKADIRRDQTAKWNLQKFMVEHKVSVADNRTAPMNTPAPASVAVESATASKPVPDPSATQAWQARVQNVALTDSHVRFDDYSRYPSVHLDIDSINLQASNLSSDLSQAASLKLKSVLNRKGTLSLSADASSGLKNITVALDAQTLSVAAFYPYFAQQLNVSLSRGDASAKGKLSILNEKGQAPKIAYDGNLRLSDFHMLEGSDNEDFLTWKTIDMDGISAKLGNAKPAVLLKKLNLVDFYVRAVLSDKGKLNLQNIMVSKTAEVPGAAAGTATAANADVIKSVIKDVTKDATKDVTQDINSIASTVAAPASDTAITASASAITPATQPAVGSAQAANPLIIRIAQTTLRGGNINFTDNFIRPNYSANLTGVSGTIGAIASDDPQAATIELTGKIDNDAPLVISGSLNPLSSPIFLDIKGSASGMELTRLTPYAAKYAGYAIDKGKLSVQVSYRVENQQLKAENEVRLDQLTFGEKIDSPTATHLPVQLALALLRDNDGKVNINLPISGSLSDPQFSVGGIIWKVLVNLITKAVTAPFSLLSSAFGGGEELAYVEFAPGMTALTPDAISKLDKLAKALNNRGSLRMDILGRIDPVTDAEGLRHISLDKKIKIAKLASLQKKNPQLAGEQLIPDDADKKAFLQDVYKAEKFSKPRNILGLAKTLPAEEVERLILSNTPVTPDHLRELAQHRADIVRDYLEQKAGVSKDRLFLIAPKLNTDGIKDKGLPSRVDFLIK
ncbi:DUF748 domain-containing protein [Undibacterium sp. Jales W-56]|uniref:DUF748 domain-containing protein n=1 Tax=Undibacterium sp. Jales W-56 TaxID=2897325 RepID=UPI0021CEE45B|nr:DUF748 domain-containing protein [Undibacterium sp. Jales W-56]MCU6432944.1 DUF748 domain-containing protein [Undibacterium sp. Jales W-56]